MSLDLSGFNGSEHLYKHLIPDVLFTDGVKYVADEAGAYWMIDLIASYQPKLVKSDNDFQLWELKVRDDKSWIVTMREDSDTPVIITQSGEYTDFPEKEIKFYACRNELNSFTIMLPGEY